MITEQEQFSAALDFQDVFRVSTQKRQVKFSLTAASGKHLPILSQHLEEMFSVSFL